MRFYIFIYLCLLVFACGHSKNNSGNNRLDSAPVINKITLIQKQEKNNQEPLPTFDKAHPNAKLLMNESFYFSPTDETAPFGNDDAVNAYTGFKIWRQKHKNNETKEFLSKQIDLLGYPGFDIKETDFLKLAPYLQQHELGSRFISGIDATIVAIGFGQLYLEGTIDKDFKEIAKTAIRRQLTPQLLAFWGDPYKAERKLKLTKMLGVLNK